MFSSCRTKSASTGDEVTVVEAEIEGSLGRSRSLPHRVREAGGIEAWNRKHSDLVNLEIALSRTCLATTVDAALAEVKPSISLGQNLTAYAYMRRLYDRNPDLYYATLTAAPALLLPVVYTPTVGEACQKFGLMPMYRRGCYLSLADKGKLAEVLREYALNELTTDSNGNFLCDCIVFSDGGRILGLGDLAAWGMGIPIGKLDLYTVFAGVNPHRTVPVILDVGCHGPEGNTDHLVIRDHELYTALKQPRETHKSSDGTLVNSVYYSKNNFIEEFFEAAVKVFGRKCLCQFEDFNSNDAFPLLAEYRDRYLTYNDDIQGTASVAVAALLGALKLRNPSNTDLLGSLKNETYLFHGAGSANLGVMKLLCHEAGVPQSKIFVTNSRGLIWRTADGKDGSFRNDEQKAWAVVGKPTYDSKDLVEVVKQLKPSCVIGAVGVQPNCFTKSMVEALVQANKTRPVVFALSNPKTQAEITAQDAYAWSNGKVIFGSGTYFSSVEVEGKLREPGQVNNVYIFPGVSFGAIGCEAKKIPERFFMVAAEAVAQSLDEKDIASDSVVPARDRLQEVSLNVATAMAMEAQKMGLAQKVLGGDQQEVKAALDKMRWRPETTIPNGQEP